MLSVQHPMLEPPTPDSESDAPACSLTRAHISLLTDSESDTASDSTDPASPSGSDSDGADARRTLRSPPMAPQASSPGGAGAECACAAMFPSCSPREACRVPHQDVHDPQPPPSHWGLCAANALLCRGAAAPLRCGRLGGYTNAYEAYVPNADAMPTAAAASARAAPLPLLAHAVNLTAPVLAGAALSATFASAWPVVLLGAVSATNALKHVRTAPAPRVVEFSPEMAARWQPTVGESASAALHYVATNAGAAASAVAAAGMAAAAVVAAPPLAAVVPSLVANIALSRDERGVYARLPDHGVLQAANDICHNLTRHDSWRPAAREFIQRVGMRCGRTLYHFQMSDAEAARGALGCRVPVGGSCAETMTRVDTVPATALMSLVDVDYYGDLAPLAALGHPIMLATFTPRRLAGTHLVDGVEAYSWYRLASGEWRYCTARASYQHHLWDWDRDVVTFDHGPLSSRRRYRYSVYHYATGDPHHSVILLRPRDVCDLPANAVPRIDARPLSRVAAVTGIRSLGSRSYAGRVELCGWDAKSYLSLPVTTLRSLAIRCGVSTTQYAHTSAIAEVRRDLGDKDANPLVPVLAYDLLNDEARVKCKLPAIAEHQISQAGDVPQARKTEAGRVTGLPITNASRFSLFHARTPGNAAVGILERAIDFQGPTPAELQGLMLDSSLLWPFLDRFARGVDGLTPYTIQQVCDVQNRPSQIDGSDAAAADLAYPERYDSRVHPFKGHGKTEPAKVGSAQRSIIASHPLLRVPESAYTLPAAKALARRTRQTIAAGRYSGDAAYVSGLDAAALSLLLVALALIAEFFEETDFTKYDGTQNAFTAIVETEALVRQFRPEYAAGIRATLGRARNAVVRETFGFVFPNSFARQSGEPITTYGNTVNNMFCSFVTLVHLHPTGDVDAAWDHLAICSGDDSVGPVPPWTTPAKLEATHASVAAMMGLRMKAVMRPARDPVSFLGRWYFNVPSGKPYVCGDIPRQAARAHLSCCSLQIPDGVAALLRAVAWMVTDASAPWFREAAAAQYARYERGSAPALTAGLREHALSTLTYHVLAVAENLDDAELRAHAVGVYREAESFDAIADYYERLAATPALDDVGILAQIAEKCTEAGFDLDANTALLTQDAQMLSAAAVLEQLGPSTTALGFIRNDRCDARIHARTGIEVPAFMVPPMYHLQVPTPQVLASARVALAGLTHVTDVFAGTGALGNCAPADAFVDAFTVGAEQHVTACGVADRHNTRMWVCRPHPRHCTAVDLAAHPAYSAGGAWLIDPPAFTPRDLRLQAYVDALGDLWQQTNDLGSAMVVVLPLGAMRQLAHLVPVHVPLDLRKSELGPGDIIVGYAGGRPPAGWPLVPAGRRDQRPLWRDVEALPKGPWARETLKFSAAWRKTSVLDYLSRDAAAALAPVSDYAAARDGDAADDGGVQLAPRAKPVKGVGIAAPGRGPRGGAARRVRTKK